MMYAIYRKRFPNARQMQDELVQLNKLPKKVQLFASFKQPHFITLQVPEGTDPPAGWSGDFVENREGGVLSS